MTQFELITIVIALTAQLTGLIAAYIRLKTDIAKIMQDIKQLQSNRRDCALEIGMKADKELLAQMNSDINKKLDTLNSQINLIVNKLIK
jgi:uncharacterized FlaG/YvyC family protein